MRKIASALLIAAALVFLPAAVRVPLPCERKSVPFSAIAGELTRLTVVCGAIPACTLNESEIYPPQNNPKQHVIFWSVTSAKPPEFDVAAQDKLLADAKAVASQYHPKCSNGKAKAVYGYSFKTWVTGSQYQIGVRLTYACCGPQVQPY
jgi:hypothetical protein